VFRRSAIGVPRNNLTDPAVYESEFRSIGIVDFDFRSTAKVHRGGPAMQR
jgi:hypothetical protein